MTENYTENFYNQQAKGSKSSAQVILPLLFEHLSPTSVVDIGCGVGTWLSTAKELGVREIHGMDGAYVQRANLQIPGTSFTSIDLEKTRLASCIGDRRFDLVMSLEVAEHLTHSRAESFVEDLTALGDVILFAAAVPFQGGTNHVNEQWPQYWEILFRNKGYVCHDFLRDVVWEDPRVEWWYAQNCFLYVKAGSAVEARLPNTTRGATARVHPLNYLNQILVWYRTYREAAEKEEIEDYVTLINASRAERMTLPTLKAIERASQNPGAKNAFPYTRMETSWPGEEIRKLEDEIASLKHLGQQATGLISPMRDAPLTLTLKDVGSEPDSRARASRELMLLREISHLQAQNQLLSDRQKELKLSLPKRGNKRRLQRFIDRLRGKKPIKVPKSEFKVLESIEDVGEMISASANYNLDEAAAKIQWAKFIALEGSDYIRQLQSRRLDPQSPLKIFMLVGGGGLGDILMATPLMQALRDRFPGCELMVGYEGAVAKEALARNPNVTHVSTLNWAELRKAMRASLSLDIFDAIVYVRCFIPYLFLCRDSRVDEGSKKELFEVNRMAAGELLAFNSNIGLSILNSQTKIHYLELMGSVTNLPISKKTPPKYHPSPEDSKFVTHTGLKEHPYITIRAGSNPGDTALARRFGISRTTKQMPPQRWNDLVSALQSSGLKVVQLGSADEQLISGVDVDLRAQTSLSETHHVMANAVCHIDTEGGLVHLAASSGTPTIALFGPTSRTFFGYDGNINLSGSKCTECWYSHDAWLYSCLSDGQNQPCFGDIPIDEIIQHTKILQQRRHKTQ